MYLVRPWPVPLCLCFKRSPLITTAYVLLSCSAKGPNRASWDICGSLGDLHVVSITTRVSGSEAALGRSPSLPIDRSGSPGLTTKCVGSSAMPVGSLVLHCLSLRLKIYPPYLRVIFLPVSLESKTGHKGAAVDESRTASKEGYLTRTFDCEERS